MFINKLYSSAIKNLLSHLRIQPCFAKRIHLRLLIAHVLLLLSKRETLDVITTVWLVSDCVISSERTMLL